MPDTPRTLTTSVVIEPTAGVSYEAWSTREIEIREIERAVLASNGTAVGSDRM